MIRIYEARSKQWYDSIRLASQCFGCNETTVKKLVDKGERIINGRMRDIRSTDMLKQNDEFNLFIKKHKLKLMIAGFYLSPDKKVYLWANKKKEWIPWKTYAFPNGNLAFKTIINREGFKTPTWIQVHEYHRRLFPELTLTPIDKIENPFT